MLRLKNTTLIKSSLFLIALFFVGCCKMGYTYITISNLSGKDKYFKAYATIRDSIQNIAWEEINQLKANGKNTIIINDEDSYDLEEFEEEKRIIFIFFDLEKTGNEKDSIVKEYSMKELEKQNWEITFPEKTTPNN